MTGRWPFVLGSFALMLVALFLMLMAIGSGSLWYGLAALICASGSGETWMKGRALRDIERLTGTRR